MTDRDLEEIEKRLDKVEEKVKRGQQPFINKHWCSVALALAAWAIGSSGHDGWGWCLFVILLIEG